MATNVVRVVVYQDIADQWRWRAEAGNGEIVAEGEAHTRAEDAARAARGVLGDGVLIYRETTTADGNGVQITEEADSGAA